MGKFFFGGHTPLYLGLKQALSLSAGLSLSLGAHAAQNTEWSCTASESGQWVCEEKEKRGPVYPRPRRQPAAPATTEPAEPRVKLSANLDWVPMEQLSAEEKSRTRPDCCGAYIEPERDYPDADVDPVEASLRISADQTRARGNIATLDGDVQVSQGFRQVRSNKAVVDREQQQVDLEGNITYREPGMLMTGDKARVNFQSGEVDVENAAFVLHESGVRGEAHSLSRPGEDIIYIDNALYTTCEPGNNSWALRASSVKIDTADSVAVARNVRLNVKDWPVLYIPWLRYPLSDKRATGLLFPNILTGNENGLDYAQPIYLNLAPHYDATITPRLLQERGLMGEAEFRYLTPSTMTVLSGGYLPDDDGGSGNDPLYTGENRWTGSINHRGGFGRRWSSRIDYTDVSDVDYFRDIDSASLEVASASHLNQQVRLGYDTDHWDLTIQGQQFETLILNGREQYRQLPRVEANGHYRFQESDLVLSLKQHYTLFDHSEDDIEGTGTPLTTDTENTTITGQRFRAEYSLTWDKEWLWGFFKPRLSAKYINYQLDDPLIGQTEESPDVFVPVAAIDTGLFFERDTPLAPGLIHSLEPRLFYVNTKFEDQSAIPNFDTSDLTFGYHQLFREDRFSGGDRIGDTEQVTLGVTSRFIDRQTGVERFRFSIGQVHYIKDRRVTLFPREAGDLDRDSSDIAMELGGYFADHWRYQADVIVNDDDGNINKGSMSLRYNDRENTIFNLAYRYTRRDNVLAGNRFVRSDIDQVDTSVVYPVGANWSLLAKYYYDLNTRQELETFAGIEYSTCCWSVNVVARRWIDRDDNFIIGSDDLKHNNGIFVQVQFRGLAGTGTRVDDILRKGIYGYQQQDF